MRTLRLSLAGTVMLALLGGPSVVVAQSEGTDLMAPASVTGVCRDVRVLSEGTNERLRDTYYGMEGVIHIHEWDSSDPRLMGGAIGRATWIGWYAPDFIAVSAVAWEFFNDQGGWVGTATGIGTLDGLDVDMLTLQGEGAYEGLTAYLLVDWTARPPTFEGVIFPGTMPESSGTT